MKHFNVNSETLVKAMEKQRNASLGTIIISGVILIIAVVVLEIAENVVDVPVETILVE